MIPPHTRSVKRRHCADGRIVCLVQVPAGVIERMFGGKVRLTRV
jgi:hypothetical protein